MEIAAPIVNDCIPKRTLKLRQISAGHAFPEPVIVTRLTPNASAGTTRSPTRLMGAGKPWIPQIFADRA
jgi:hypothetical protein